METVIGIVLFLFVLGGVYYLATRKKKEEYVPGGSDYPLPNDNQWEELPRLNQDRAF